MHHPDTDGTHGNRFGEVTMMDARILKPQVLICVCAKPYHTKRTNRMPRPHRTNVWVSMAQFVKVVLA